ncbi:MAG: helix-turn-helix domain-containing protein [Spirochaetes bacterium]|nr:MAG: helix-turn-helix domain-containing protein [Spirochaetota bacterium]
MEAIGEKLRNAREQQGYSIEQISRDTNIAKHYLLAFENEDFSVFPGEPYLLGFLRTYSEYLNLPPDDMIALYKNMKIQEQPFPMEELLNKKRTLPVLPVLFTVILVAGLGTAAFLFIPRIIDAVRASRAADRGGGRVTTAENSIYKMDEEILERRFLKGDQVQIILNESAFNIKFANISDKLHLETPAGEISLTLGEEKLLDLDGDGKGDIKVYLRDIDREEDMEAVVIRFDKFTQATVPTSEAALIEEGLPAEEGSASIPSVGSPGSPSRRQEIYNILRERTPQPITLDIIFRGYCLLRYLADGERQEQRYFHKGESFRLEASKEIRLWVSNAGALQARISGKDINLGRSGEVSTKIIRWVKDEQADFYNLLLIPMY